MFCAWPCLLRQVGTVLGSPCDCIVTRITYANPGSRHLDYINDVASFPEVYGVLEAMGLISFVSYNWAYNEDFILQFYATVYFNNDFARSFKWRSGNRVLSGSMNDLASITGMSSSLSLRRAMPLLFSTAAPSRRLHSLMAARAPLVALKG